MFGPISNSTCPYIVPWSPLNQARALKTLEKGRHGNAMPCRPPLPCHHALAHPSPLQPGPPCQTTPPHSTEHACPSPGRRNAMQAPDTSAPMAPRPCRRRRGHAHGHPLATSRLATSRNPWPPSLHVEHHRDTATPPDTRSTPTRARRRRRR